MQKRTGWAPGLSWERVRGANAAETQLRAQKRLCLEQVPCLLTLKHCPNVAFAGVDSPEDVTGRTYQELFHTGGFVVSDGEVLETVTLGESRCGLSRGCERAAAAPGLVRWFAGTFHKICGRCPPLLAVAGAILSVCSTPQTPSGLWVWVRAFRNIYVQRGPPRWSGPGAGVAQGRLAWRREGKVETLLPSSAS